MSILLFVYVYIFYYYFQNYAVKDLEKKNNLLINVVDL